MQKQWTIGALVVIIIGVIAALGYFASRGQSDTVSSANDQAVRATVAEFGSKLKNVSLLSPTAPADMAAQYGAYVTPELLAAWQADPASAPGRQTSSPWPDRIEVTSVEQIGEGQLYRVEGNVVEVANGEVQGAFAAMYPVVISLVERDGAWRIVQWERSSMQEPPAQP